MTFRCMIIVVLTIIYQCGVTSPVSAVAQIDIVNGDGPNEGFNDTAQVAPVAGNPGTTLGAQRLNAFRAAADVWGSMLNSAVPGLQPK
jgi:hypothetical protein